MPEGKWISANWRAHRPKAGRTVYTATECAHGANVEHSLAEAVGCGLLQAVREARGVTRMDLAARLSVHYNTLARWEQGRFAPRTGPVVAAVETWLLEGT